MKANPGYVFAARTAATGQPEYLNVTAEAGATGRDKAVISRHRKYPEHPAHPDNPLGQVVNASRGWRGASLEDIQAYWARIPKGRQRGPKRRPDLHPQDVTKTQWAALVALTLGAPPKTATGSIKTGTLCRLVRKGYLTPSYKPTPKAQSALNEFKKATP